MGGSSRPSPRAGPEAAGGSLLATPLRAHLSQSQRHSPTLPASPHVFFMTVTEIVTSQGQDLQVPSRHCGPSSNLVPRQTGGPHDHTRPGPLGGHVCLAGHPYAQEQAPHTPPNWRPPKQHKHSLRPALLVLRSLALCFRRGVKGGDWMLTIQDK